MKVLGIVGSPRKNGNTAVLVKEVLDTAASYGVETEMINVTDYDIKPCDGCETCTPTGKCKIKDDMQAIYTKLLESDGIVFGSPVYFWGVTAQLKVLIDRSFVFRRGRRLRNKVAGAVLVARDTGASSAFSALNDFFSLHRMLPARSIGPRTVEELAQERGGAAIGYADKRGEVRENKKAMAEARALGRMMVETINVLKKK